MNFGNFFFFCNMVVLRACQYENFVLESCRVESVIRVSGVNGLLVLSGRWREKRGRRAVAVAVLHCMVVLLRPAPAPRPPLSPPRPPHRSTVLRVQSFGDARAGATFFSASIRISPSSRFHFRLQFRQCPTHFLFLYRNVHQSRCSPVYLVPVILELRCLCNQVISAAPVTQSTNGHYGEIPQVCPSDKTLHVSERRMTHTLSLLPHSFLITSAILTAGHKTLCIILNKLVFIVHTAVTIAFGSILD